MEGENPEQHPKNSAQGTLFESNILSFSMKSLLQSVSGG